MSRFCRWTCDMTLTWFSYVTDISQSEEWPWTLNLYLHYYHIFCFCECINSSSYLASTAVSEPHVQLTQGDGRDIPWTSAGRWGLWHGRQRPTGICTLANINIYYLYKMLHVWLCGDNDTKGIISDIVIMLHLGTVAVIGSLFRHKQSLSRYGLCSQC